MKSHLKTEPYNSENMLEKKRKLFFLFYFMLLHEVVWLLMLLHEIVSCLR